jgi:hypothetical protein
MSDKKGTANCREGPYTKATFGINVVFLVILALAIIGGIVGYFFLAPYISQLQNLGNVMDQIPDMP